MPIWVNIATLCMNAAIYGSLGTLRVLAGRIDTPGWVAFGLATFSTALTIPVLIVKLGAA